MRDEAGSDDGRLQERRYGFTDRQLRRHAGTQARRLVGLARGSKEHEPFCPASSMVLLLLQLP